MPRSVIEPGAPHAQRGRPPNPASPRPSRARPIAAGCGATPGEEIPRSAYDRRGRSVAPGAGDKVHGTGPMPDAPRWLREERPAPVLSQGTGRRCPAPSRRSVASWFIRSTRVAGRSYTAIACRCPDLFPEAINPGYIAVSRSHVNRGRQQSGTDGDGPYHPLSDFGGYVAHRGSRVSARLDLPKAPPKPFSSIWAVSTPQDAGRTSRERRSRPRRG